MVGNLSSFKSMVYREIGGRLGLEKQDVEFRLFVSGFEPELASTENCECGLVWFPGVEFVFCQPLPLGL